MLHTTQVMHEQVLLLSLLVIIVCFYIMTTADNIECVQQTGAVAAYHGASTVWLAGGSSANWSMSDMKRCIMASSPA
jgi:hypothetical protein